MKNIILALLKKILFRILNNIYIYIYNKLKYLIEINKKSFFT